ncbi:molybdenum cofactor guanylyltransferase [Nocardiopsis sp. RSe5-2]|uniref:Molybdenum cofactor guanylyltransferase n=1 Tax=Nocardiopsis endophytica TaxID=3018445 RepID=A0ABT4U9B0_9ACTN|nr:molybdenum cofactor guanylyltransferase [Nocardiopsis endophytica]MDA2812937.1 molybdenum cofactor guanylyltransferase [Nocardiopsis endophytica]
MEALQECDSVILAGGRARRMGGADKPGLEAGGATLLERVAAAAPGRVVVVGPPRERPHAVYVREDPPGSGPVPALRAGAAEVRAPWTAVLAGDMPFLRAEHVTALRAAAEGRHGAVMVDAEGREQWLLGVWRTDRLRAGLEAYPGASLRGLFAPSGSGCIRPFDYARVRTPEGAELAAFDCDTPEELARARELLRDGTD